MAFRLQEGASRNCRLPVRSCAGVKGICSGAEVSRVFTKALTDAASREIQCCWGPEAAGSNYQNGAAAQLGLGCGV